jgi:CcmD family protein
MNNSTYPALFFGYSAIWIIIAFYLISLIRRVKKIEQELNDRN